MPLHHTVRYNSDSSLQPLYNKIVQFLKLIESGPEGLRSLGLPVMSRPLYQAELRAPQQNKTNIGYKMLLAVFLIATI